MSKKLLEESTVRSFMKLANLQPLSQKFISENYGSKQEELDEEEEMDEEEELDEELAPPADERRPETGLQEEEELDEEVLDEEMEEEGDMKAEGREGGDKTPSSPKQKVKGVTKPTKVKGAHADHKMTAAKTGGSHHTSDTDTISTKSHSVKRTKNNSQFDIVAESLEEQDEMPPEGEEAGAETPSDAAGEGGDHQGKMKGLIRDMLNTLQQMGSEYGMTMEVSDEGEGGGEEAAPPEGEAPPEGGEEMMQEKVDEMVENLTRRVAARLVKESKKKR